MPIRPELRHFYATPEWREARKRILLRAGGQFDFLGNYESGARCELCGKPDRTKVETRLLSVLGLPRMWWRSTGTGWRDHEGQASVPPRFYRAERFIRVVLAVVHLNHKPGDDRDENLKALCQWCHLNWDLFQHKLTRSVRKDAARPMLAEVNA